MCTCVHSVYWIRVYAEVLRARVCAMNQDCAQPDIDDDVSPVAAPRRTPLQRAVTAAVNEICAVYFADGTMLPIVVERCMSTMMGRFVMPEHGAPTGCITLEALRLELHVSVPTLDGYLRTFESQGWMRSVVDADTDIEYFYVLCADVVRVFRACVRVELDAYDCASTPDVGAAFWCTVCRRALTLADLTAHGIREFDRVRCPVCVSGRYDVDNAFRLAAPVRLTESGTMTASAGVAAAVPNGGDDVEVYMKPLLVPPPSDVHSRVVYSIRPLLRSLELLEAECTAESGALAHAAAQEARKHTRPVPPRLVRARVSAVGGPNFDVYIGDSRATRRHSRGRSVQLKRTEWSLPFTGGSTERMRALDLEQFRAYVRDTPGMLAKLSSLRGKRLGCTCDLKQCHGRVIIDLFCTHVMA